MPVKPDSYHDTNSATWLDLKSNQTYRLRVHLWEGAEHAKSASEGTLVFTYGKFDAQFVERGGVAGALKGISVDIDFAEVCDIKLAATTQRAMTLELTLQALNGAAIGATFHKTLGKSGKSKVRLTLEYAFEG